MNTYRQHRSLLKEEESFIDVPITLQTRAPFSRSLESSSVELGARESTSSDTCFVCSLGDSWSGSSKIETRTLGVTSTPSAALRPAWSAP